MFIIEESKKCLFEKSKFDYLNYNEKDYYDNFNKLKEKNKDYILMLKQIGGMKLIREVLRFTIPMEKIEKIEPYYISTNDMWLISYVFYNIGKEGQKLNHYLNYIKKENNKNIKKYLSYSIEELEKEFDKNDIYKEYYYDENNYNENIKVESIFPSSIIFYYVSNNLEEDEIVNFCIKYRLKRLKEVKIYEDYLSYNRAKEFYESRKKDFKANCFVREFFTHELFSFLLDFDEENGEDSEVDFIIGG